MREEILNIVFGMIVLGLVSCHMVRAVSAVVKDMDYVSEVMFSEEEIDEVSFGGYTVVKDFFVQK